ncbi:MAG: lytic murein transglycosylase B, partial [Burkholderiales bacterium]|nr:lytic murein transglycosylase B [Burkholderiales bacterium]
TTPATTRPWSEYYPPFLTASRIEGGAQFWDDHAAELARAERDFGVAPEIIVATIGVETLYGKNTGRYRVLDALATLAFDYPRRGEFFRSELEQYLLLARETGFDPLTLKGSYAGAMGLGQFIPRSYRRYAIDFDGDGQINLWHPADAIGSVANYYRDYGWQHGAPVVLRAGAFDNYQQFLQREIKPQTTLAEFQSALVTVREPLPADTLATLFTLEADDGLQYWLGLNNFYVITRYNRSVFYAMTVHLLSQEILRRSTEPMVESNGDRPQ